MDAVYQRIARDIRQRIERGELRPGDRVPSTREITSTWQVAMATATKVLAVLQDDGLVHAVPGVGTVVSEREDRAGPEASKGEAADLNVDRLVRVAVEIADREGLGGLSMRRVAAQLGVATMSLYRHVPGKDELVLRMIDAAMGARPIPHVDGDWRVRLEAAARVQWDLFRAHPWLAGAMSMTRPQLLPSAVAHTEWMLHALEGHGLELEEMLHAVVTLFGFVRGIAVNLELEAEQRQQTGITDDEWLAGQTDAFAALVGSGRFPLFARMVQLDLDMDLGTLFEFGLARMLDGIGEWISARTALQSQRTS